MSAFESTLDQIGSMAPPRIIRIPLSAWVATYSGRPECEVLMGIRLPGQEDAESIEIEALKAMRAAIADGDDAALRAYNEAKLIGVVATCISDPGDISQPHPLFETPDALLRLSLTPQGLRFIFDEIERLQIETSPIFPEASDDDVALFVRMIQEGALADSLDPTKAPRVRRYIATCLEILTNG